MMNEKINLKIEYIDIAELVPYELNARTHTQDQVKQIETSINEFGFVNPILVDKDNMIIAGHGRLMAAKKAGIEKVPVIFLPHLDHSQSIALSLADNRIAENAGWNEENITKILNELENANFDTQILGFSNKELEQFREDFDIDEEKAIIENEAPEIIDAPVSSLGDLWVLGEHRLLCADSCDKSELMRLMNGDTAQMVFTDPPYNVDYSGRSEKLNGKNSIMNDNNGDDFFNFLLTFFSNTMDFVDGSFYVCMGGSELHTLFSAFTKAGGRWETYIVWIKDKFAISRTKYQRQHEWILYGNPYDKAHDAILLGSKKGTTANWYGGRNQTDVWEIARPPRNELHPTMKPVALVEKAIRNSSKVADIIFDGFGGSGTTLITCEKTGRRCRMVELDPKYIDVIIKRWEKFTKKTAIHEQSGKTFSEISEMRKDNK